MGRARDSGQATVELLALLPLVAAFAAVLLQLLVAGQAMWLAQSAARAAARAEAVGSDADAAARRSLPGYLEPGLRVTRDQTGTATVRVRIPALVGGTLTSVGGSARVASQTQP